MIDPLLLVTDRKQARGSLADIPAWAEDTGNELLHTETEGGRFVFLVRKVSDSL